MNPRGNPTHGLSRTLTYARWKSMMARCHNPNASNFAHYGGRGIVVCDRWRESFESFLADMGECPSKAMTLDRLENALGYHPGNCRWATKAAQNQHRSHNVALTYAGRTQIVSAWASEVGISANTLRMRLRLGWTVEAALTVPKGGKRP